MKTWTEAELVEKCFDEWGPEGKPATAELQSRYVKQWLQEKVRHHEHAAVALIARIEAVLREVQAELPADERHRFFYRIDAQHLAKSPDSILGKMLRDCESPPEGQPSICFNNFRDQMEDLGRFRIVTNFLSDAELVERALTGAYASSGHVLTRAQKALHDEYKLKDNRFQDRIRMRPSDRKKGERCYRGCFYPAQHVSLKVEVQIMTALAEAWDQKDHFLVYERRRRSEPVALQDDMEMYAHSELLYLADVFFDQLKSRQSDVGGAR
jgi:ppGpp synthetase/RelA/SpoT-type nucleotidyltranferase